MLLPQPHTDCLSDVTTLSNSFGTSLSLHLQITTGVILSLHVLLMIFAALTVDYPGNFNRRRRKTEPSVWSPTDPGPPPTGCRSAGLTPHNYVNLTATDDLSTYPW